MHRSHAWLTTLLGLSFGAILSVTCAQPYPPGGDCRYNPNCGGGGNGAFCNHNSDCASGHCCEKDECDGGICTSACDHDNDCAPGLLCEHHECFYACNNNDAECAPDQKCEHGRVCEW